MGRKGWAGSPPSDDAEARKRIVDAAMRCIDQRGPAQTTLSHVADDLGITRRTVYRYFDGTDALFASVAEAALDGFVARIADLTADLDVADQLVEVVAYIIEQLPHQPQLELLLANDPTNMFSRRMLAPAVIDRCRTMLEHTHIDWTAMGYDEDGLDELVEFLLRIIQSMVVAPMEPPRTGRELRAFLHRWVGHALG
jgi:AcrR family transcriptional regulator